MIEQILKSIVIENRRLIIPTIGAFLTKDVEDAKKKVTFSSFLKYDDGLLTKLLCDSKNISEAEAKQEIADFAQRISSALDSGNNYTIGDFGYFTKDNNGIIDFVVENINTVVEFTMPKVEEPVIPPYVPPVIETPVVETPVFVQPQYVPPQYVPPQYTPPQEEQNNDFDFSKIIIPSANNNNSATSTTSMSDRPPKKNNVGYWVLAIILVIIATLLLLYLFSKDFKHTVNSLFGSKQNVETVKTDQAKNAVAPVDTAKIAQQDTVANRQRTEQSAQQSKPISAGDANGKYQVVLGSYLERSVAENFADEMRGKGYTVKIPERLAGEWVLVIGYETNDQNDAVRMQERFISEGYDDAYVRTRPGAAGSTSSQTSTSTPPPMQTSTPQVAPSSQQQSSSSNTNFKTTITKRGRYQVIAGCFFERSNAENLAKELLAKGFDVTVPERLYGEWTIVIVCETDDRNEAEKYKNQCVAAGYDDAWIRTR